MSKKYLDFKPIFIKVFFTYLFICFLSLIFRYSYDLESLLNNVQYKYLIVLNLVCIFFGFPFTTIFDFILIKIFGLNYVLYFSPVLSILSLIQVLILRKINFTYSKDLFFKKQEKNFIFNIFEEVTFRSSYILIIRSLPILPHILGSYIIASSNIKKNIILTYTLLGSILYYLFLFLIITKF